MYNSLPRTIVDEGVTYTLGMSFNAKGYVLEYRSLENGNLLVSGFRQSKGEAAEQLYRALVKRKLI